MSFAPMHYRKLPIAEHGKFGQLPFLVRGTAAMILKFCDDRGAFELDGKAPIDAVTRKCGAEPSERRAIANHIQELLRVGYLRLDNDTLVVVSQEAEWERLDSTRASGSGQASSRPRSSRAGRSAGQSRDSRGTVAGRQGLDSSTRNHSADPLALDKIYKTRSDQQEEKRSSPIGEGVQGEPIPKTDPTPSLRKQQFDEAVGKAPASWGMDGSGAHQSDLAKAQTPTPVPSAPSPPSPRQGPFVAVVDSNSVRGQIPPATGAGNMPATLVDLGAPTAAKTKPTKRAPTKAKRADDNNGEPCPVDFAPNEAHYAFGRELGLQKKHVDYFAGEMRDRAESDRWLSGNWNAKFRNFMRKGLEFRRGEPPVVPEPLPPKKPMPPCPPPSPEVLARAEEWKKRMEAGEQIDIKSLFKPKFVVPPVQECSEDMVG